MPDLLVILPVHGRPQSLPPFLEAFHATAGGGADLILVMDGDDRSYDDVLDSGVARGVYGLVLPGRQPTSVKVNAASKSRVARYRAVMFMGDDCRCITPGWPGAMLAALDEMGGTGWVYVNDLQHRAEQLPCQCLVSSDIVQALGWLAEPSLHHFFMDNVWDQMGRQLDRLRFLPDVFIEHLHWAWGKAPMDELYDYALRTFWAHDEAEFRRWERERAKKDVEKVRALL